MLKAKGVVDAVPNSGAGVPLDPPEPKVNLGAALAAGVPTSNERLFSVGGSVGAPSAAPKAKGLAVVAGLLEGVPLVVPNAKVGVPLSKGGLGSELSVLEFLEEPKTKLDVGAFSVEEVLLPKAKGSEDAMLLESGIAEVDAENVLDGKEPNTLWTAAELLGRSNENTFSFADSLVAPGAGGASAGNALSAADCAVVGTPKLKPRALTAGAGAGGAAGALFAAQKPSGGERDRAGALARMLEPAKKLGIAGLFSALPEGVDNSVGLG